EAGELVHEQPVAHPGEHLVVAGGPREELRLVRSHTRCPAVAGTLRGPGRRRAGRAARVRVVEVPDESAVLDQRHPAAGEALAVDVPRGQGGRVDRVVEQGDAL